MPPKFATITINFREHIPSIDVADEAGRTMGETTSVAWLKSSTLMRIR